MEALGASDLCRGLIVVDRDRDLHRDALIHVMDQTVDINPSDCGSIAVDRGPIVARSWPDRHAIVAHSTCNWSHD